jgi:hypothetical protein
MVVFNTDAHKLQVYALLTDTTHVVNEIFVGSQSDPNLLTSLYQSFVSPIDGRVTAVELMLKDGTGVAYPFIYLGGQGSYSVPSYSQLTWFTFNLTYQFPVFAGSPTSFFLDGPGVYSRVFATNSNYPNGSAGGFASPQDDVLFRVHIQPVPGSYGWQNLH